MRDVDPIEDLAALQAFLTTPLDRLLHPSAQPDPTKAVVELFHRVVKTVPAYRSFLQYQGIDPATIQDFAAFQQLPLATKANYLQQHTLAQLCRQGELTTCDFIAVSSGSTGQPTFWARAVADELQIAARFEQIFHDSFHADRRRTLAVICFAMGTWVGGMFTASCCRHLASKGYPLTVITPGNNKTEIFRVVQALGSQFDQVVLLGYPPFLKDVIDSGIAQGIVWQDYSIKLVMAGEVFSEEWRSLVGARSSSIQASSTQANSIQPSSTQPSSTQPSSIQICYDSASLYGTADAGVLGNETPLSICIRRWLATHPDAARELFGESRLPTLVQYDPFSRFFEAQDGTLLFSGDNGMPLIRYHISDTGGVIPYDRMLHFLAERGFDPVAALQNSLPESLTDTGEIRGVRPLPFVYVFGRSHFTVSYFGANVYPENVTVGLEQAPICEWVTGKFVMQVQEDIDRNTVLSIVVELAPGIEGTTAMQQQIAHSIQHHLQRLNSEFANYVPAAKQLPQIQLAATGDPEYFPVGVKHRYTRKN